MKIYIRVADMTLNNQELKALDYLVKDIDKFIYGPIKDKMLEDGGLRLLKDIVYFYRQRMEESE